MGAQNRGSAAWFTSASPLIRDRGHLRVSRACRRVGYRPGPASTIPAFVRREKFGLGVASESDGTRLAGDCRQNPRPAPQFRVKNPCLLGVLASGWR